MRFEVRTLADAQALSRVLEHFALRTLLLDRVEATRDGDMLNIILEIAGLDEPLAQMIVEKIRASVMVLEVVRSPQSEQYLDGVAL
ncbi:MAG: hypothetical protein U1E68_07870 [Sphingomonadaceae bacterium]|jgi:hypothetical protein